MKPFIICRWEGFSDFACHASWNWNSDVLSQVSPAPTYKLAICCISVTFVKSHVFMVTMVLTIAVVGSLENVHIEANIVEALMLSYAPGFSIVQLGSDFLTLPAAYALNHFWHWLADSTLTPEKCESVCSFLSTL